MRHAVCRARVGNFWPAAETAFGLIPGAGGVQHLVRLIGRARALEVMLSADDYDAQLAERCAAGVSRALPADALGEYRKRFP